MHDAYEKAAVGAGWETQQASRKPWADVPEANKATMRAAVEALWQAVVQPEVERLDRVRALCDVWVYLEDEARDEGTKGVITYIGASRALRAALDGPDE